MVTKKRGGGASSFFKIKKVGLLVIYSVLILFSFLGILGASNHNVNGSADENVIFSVKTIDFESPVTLEDFLDFSYLLRSFSDINDNIVVKFYLEKDGEIISSGQDTVYLSGPKETSETTKIFLPSNLESGVYTLNTEINYKGQVSGKSYRTIEIIVKNGFATIKENMTSTIYIIISLILLALLNVLVIYLLERKKINAAVVAEKNIIKKYKMSFLILSLFAILGGLIYYLNSINAFLKIPVYFYYLLFGILLLSIILVGVRQINLFTIIKKKFS